MQRIQIDWKTVTDSIPEAFLVTQTVANATTTSRTFMTKQQIHNLLLTHPQVQIPFQDVLPLRTMFLTSERGRAYWAPFETQYQVDRDPFSKTKWLL